MNDRFKFRIWDKRSKRYEERYVIGSDGWVYQLDDIDDNWYDLIPNEEVIVEQCTGVKDHTGKLIFEGDVVRMYIPCEDKHRLCVVEYKIDEEDTAQWLCRYLDGKRKHNTFGSTIEITAEYLSGSYCEIIGNIHEYSADA